MAPRTQEQNERIRAEQRKRILDASRTLFARRGLAATKASDIAAAAGISHGLVYQYFESKEEIFTAIVEQSLEGALWVATTAREQPGAPLDRIAWLLDAMLRGRRESADHMLIIIQVSTSEAVPESARERINRYGPRIFGNVVKLIEDAQAARQVVEGDPVKLATVLLACVQGLVIAGVTGDTCHDSLSEREMVLRMLRA